MNKIYKIIFNWLTNALVVANEISRSTGKRRGENSAGGAIKADTLTQNSCAFLGKKTLMVLAFGLTACK